MRGSIGKYYCHCVNGKNHESLRKRQLSRSSETFLFFHLSIFISFIADKWCLRFESLTKSCLCLTSKRCHAARSGLCLLSEKRKQNCDAKRFLKKFYLLCVSYHIENLILITSTYQVENNKNVDDSRYFLELNYLKSQVAFKLTARSWRVIVVRWKWKKSQVKFTNSPQSLDNRWVFKSR